MTHRSKRPNQPEGTERSHIFLLNIIYNITAVKCKPRAFIRHINPRHLTSATIMVHNLTN
ncbi:hypothetical protein L211DRAFT_838707 [Terfezia boudieri ATCC MYA-4762]|uniref:Uncharacterized protein n=1 Tax=Terfezia boudieri ATCC MYA-4762 TaxID=1051890 RepID=A0A3N4LK15_9PEZI|nr:hypothetical protein L211DRAFT_838707 [Terfezia boudieri ATCC MYA-4762]